MAFTLKVYLQKEDAEDKIRHTSWTMGAKGAEGAGALQGLSDKVLELFPRLKGKSFTVQARDDQGDLTPLSVDKDVQDAAQAATQAGSDVITVVVAEDGIDPKRKRAWRKRLRESVPRAHRRWAKGYIQSWRQKHLQNASSESGQDDEPAEVKGHTDIPETYPLWLSNMLPRWHKKWDGEINVIPKVSGGEGQKNEHKDSVPQEFRKWVRSYLKQRHGKRERPKLKAKAKSVEEEESTEAAEAAGEAEKSEEKKKAPIKYKSLMDKVPKGQRRWTKAYIRQWRQDSVQNASGESGPDEAQAGKGSDREKHEVPESYQQWLDIMLPRWHRKWGGGVSGPKEEKQDEVDGTKPSVPGDYRKWVRQFLARRYGKKESPALVDGQ